jgi:hypothetical protein
MNAEPHDTPQRPRTLTAQWFALLGPPVIWLLQFEARYALAANVRGSAANVAMTVIAVAALAFVGACALVAFRQWRLAHASPLHQLAAVGERARFMGALGLASAGLFFLVTVAQLLADFFISPGKS